MSPGLGVRHCTCAQYLLCRDLERLGRQSTLRGSPEPPRLSTMPWVRRSKAAWHQASQGSFSAAVDVGGRCTNAAEVCPSDRRSLPLVAGTPASPAQWSLVTPTEACPSTAKNLQPVLGPVGFEFLLSEDRRVGHVSVGKIVGVVAAMVGPCSGQRPCGCQ